MPFIMNNNLSDKINLVFIDLNHHIRYTCAFIMLSYLTAAMSKLKTVIPNLKYTLCSTRYSFSKLTD